MVREGGSDGVVADPDRHQTAVDVSKQPPCIKYVEPRLWVFSPRRERLDGVANHDHPTFGTVRVVLELAVPIGLSARQVV